MKKTHDYFHHYRGYWSGSGRCPTRIYRDDIRVPVVTCSQLSNNPNTSVTNMAEYLAAEIIDEHRLPTPLVWIEHWPEETTDGGEETFELVGFSGYEVTQRAPYLGETRAWIGEPTWKPLDRATVEVLVGGKV